MRTPLSRTTPDKKLALVLDALERDLIESTDEEIREAAESLGMDIDMEASAAWLGIKWKSRWSAEDWFDRDELRRVLETQLVLKGPKKEDET